MTWANVGWLAILSTESYFYFPFTNKPDSWDIIKVEIQISVYGVSKTTPCNAVIIEDTTWGELTLNWANKPNRGQNIDAENDGLISMDANYLIDVTDYISSRSDLSIAIYCRDSLLNDEIFIHTRESILSNTRPKLIWTYNTYPINDGDSDNDSDDDDEMEELLRSISGYDMFILLGGILGIIVVLIKKLKRKN